MLRAHLRTILVSCLGLAVVSVAGGAYVYKDTLHRLMLAKSLFSGAEQYERFDRMHEFYPTSIVQASSAPKSFPEGAAFTLPAAFDFEGTPSRTETFLTETDTSALLVLQNGNMRLEHYDLTGGRDVPWLSWSMAKSVISALIGIAVDDGDIESLQDPVTKYVPALKGSGYDGVAIKDILQMSSGVSWDEDYSDHDSDINRFARTFAFGGSFTEFAATLDPAREPGAYKLYNSIDTQVLGLLLASATGQSVTAYMQERLWDPLGAESNARWILDGDEVEMSFGGLNATARDYAKLGELYRNKGVVGATRIFSKDWFTASVTPDAEYLEPGGKALPGAPHGYGHNLGYGYQWWVLDGDEGEFAAMGIYNQFIYVNPSVDLVIVKLSANSQYGVTMGEESSRELETIALFRQIARELAPEPVTPAA
ncbi:MAG: serine hydrolase [Henriciella sp.]|nr:serine hydrolase [Henriciella sp.]